MGIISGTNRRTSSASGWIKFAILGVIVIVTLQGVNCDQEPTESQCRPYIEKALKEKHIDVEEDRSEQETQTSAEISTEQEENPPTDELTDSTEGSTPDSTPDVESEETQEENDTKEEAVSAEKDSEGETKEDSKEDEDGKSEEKGESAEVADTEGASDEDGGPSGEEKESGEQDSAEKPETEEEKSGEDVKSEETTETKDESVEGQTDEKDGDSQEGDTQVDTKEAESGEADDDKTKEESDTEENKTGEDTESGEVGDDKTKEEESAEAEDKTKEDETDSAETEEKTKEEESGEAGDDTTAEVGSGEVDDQTKEESDEAADDQTKEGEGSGEGDDGSTEGDTKEQTGTDEQDTKEDQTDSQEGDSKEEKPEGDSSEDTKEQADASTEEQATKEETASEEDSKQDDTASTETADDSKAEASVEGDSQEQDTKEETTEVTTEKDETKEESVEVQADESESGEKASASEEEAKSEGEASDEDKSQESTPEEDLTKEVLIPENLRPRDHITKILRLDEDSVETESVLAKAIDSTLKTLKNIYDNAIKPLELLYKYRDLSNRHFGDPEIFSKPLILFMGPWSGGKSSTINYLLNNEFTHMSLRTGAEPSPAYFNIMMYGKDEEILDGTQLAADWTFSGLQKFGQGLLDRLRGVKLPSRLLEKVNIVEIPGILEIRKQVQRIFPFNDACQWFIDRADIIFLVYDPAKLDVGPETEAILDQLKGREYQTRIILNKADQVKPEELMRVQGTLIWNISPLMSSTEPPVMYTTSLWSLPYEVGAPTRLLLAQERAFLRDLREAVDKRVENKIASARRFAVRVRNHAKMVDCYLTTYYNHKTFFGNRKKISDDIIENPQKYHIYEGLSTLTNISRYDLPDPDVYRDFFKINPLYDFTKLSDTCTYFRGCPINKLDVAIAYDLPELVGKYKKAIEAAKEQIKKTNS